MKHKKVRANSRRSSLVWKTLLLLFVFAAAFSLQLHPISLQHQETSLSLVHVTVATELDDTPIVSDTDSITTSESEQGDEKEESEDLETGSIDQGSEGEEKGEENEEGDKANDDDNSDADANTEENKETESAEEVLLRNDLDAELRKAQDEQEAVVQQSSFETTTTPIASSGKSRKGHKAKSPEKGADYVEFRKPSTTNIGGHIVYECKPLGVKQTVTPDGKIMDPVLLNVTKRNLFPYNEKYYYAHMVTSVEFGGGLVAAWQSAPHVLPDVSGRIRYAVEGLQQQTVLWAASFDQGKTWTEATEVPVHRKGAVWGPVLHADKKNNVLWLFYAESNRCLRPTSPPTWEPGGHLKVITFKGDLESGRWGVPRMLMEQRRDDLPNVVANRVTETKDGQWALPYWKEFTFRTRLNELADQNEQSAAILALRDSCQAEKLLTNFSQSDHRLSNNTEDVRESVAGVLISKDVGESWVARGKLEHPHTSLIEAVIAEVELVPTKLVEEGLPKEKQGNGMEDPPAVAKVSKDGRLMMMFRSGMGCMFRSYSLNNGHDWSFPEVSELINPNSKLDVLRLSTGHLVMAFNNHARAILGCQRCRTHLHLAVSDNDGVSWKLLAQIDDEERDGVRVHYPYMLERPEEKKLLVFYTRFYLGKCAEERRARDPPCHARDNPEQGVYVAEVDLSPILANTVPQLMEALPQLDVTKSNHTEVLKVFMENWVLLKMERIKESPKRLLVVSMAKLEARLTPSGNRKKSLEIWNKLADSIADSYEMHSLGGAHELRKRASLMLHTYQFLQKQLVLQGFKNQEGQYRALELIERDALHVATPPYAAI